ncbi:MAG: hypothetical protein M1834_007494 [Cirrosporium novae-zelandiae]|nr:MAG: hypothetical protein M1834_007494 [Cirrosporium novae-zelandiae]
MSSNPTGSPPRLPDPPSHVSSPSLGNVSPPNSHIRNVSSQSVLSQRSQQSARSGRSGHSVRPSISTQALSSDIDGLFSPPQPIQDFAIQRPYSAGRSRPHSRNVSTDLSPEGGLRSRSASRPRTSAGTRNSTPHGLPPNSNDSGPNSASASRNSTPSGILRKPMPSSLAGLTPPPIPTDDTSTSESRRRRLSWFPGMLPAKMPGKLHKASRSTSDISNSSSGPKAWVLGPAGGNPYDTSPLINGQKIPELWDDSGDALIYLFPKESGKGPSFKIHSSTFTASRNLISIAFGTSDPENNRLSFGSEPLEPSQEIELDHAPVFTQLNGATDAPTHDIHVYIPLPLKSNLSTPNAKLLPEDVETLISHRNLFAFLTSGALVATLRHSSPFATLLDVSDLLAHFEFSNYDGSTYGEEPETAFNRYCEEFLLADVKHSREKTIEGVVLAERMRSADLYHQTFVHAAGNWEELVRLKSPKFDLISNVTRNRLERASLDLATRIRNVEIRLTDFEFPSLFTGIANSQTSEESKLVDFKAWEKSYTNMRKFTLGVYRKKYGDWPPRASSKKNNFELDGLNRMVLREVYQDFSDIYDVLVDRLSLTTRTMNMPSQDTEPTDQDVTGKIIRRILSEYDRSSPPVQPPVPFDVPIYPTLASIKRDYEAMDPMRQFKERGKRLRSSDISVMLMQACNREDIKPSAFLKSFIEYERKEAHGKNVEEIRDLRIGQWIFMYVVIQSLPLLIVDAPNLHYTNGVEYFLCEIPRGGLPWAREESGRKMNWYGIAGGSGVVSMPSDVVESSIEGIYQRSHCWVMADKWTSGAAFAQPNTPLSDPSSLSPELQPPNYSPDGLRPPSQGSERGGGRSRRTSFHLGLEALPLPPGIDPGSNSRPVSVHNPNLSFNDILGKK